MKTMNGIESDRAGTIVEGLILLENRRAIEAGTPLFRIV